MIGAELTLLDEETKNLLTNDEVLSLLKEGRGAEQIRRDENSCVWESFSSKDDSIFIALFNLSDTESEVSINFEELEIQAKSYKIRDLWEKKELVPVSEKISGKIPAHGAMLLSLR